MSAPVSRTPDEKSARFSKEAGIFPPIGFLFGLGIYKYAVGRLVKIRTKNPHVLVKEEGGFSAISSSLQA